MCRGIAAVVGREVARVERPPCAYRPCLIEPGVAEMHRCLHRRTVTAILRRGKRVMIQFDGNSRIVIEPRMTGLVLLTDPPDEDHLRLRIQFRNRSGQPNELLVWDRRGLGTIRWMRESDFDRRIDSRLGPDALSITRDQLREAMRWSRRPIKVALLDQTRVAGIGNLYAAEMLFVAGIDPRTRCDRLSGPQWERLHGSITSVLNDAIAHEGSTLSDGTYRNALNQTGGYQNMHRVYDRAGRQCPRCVGEIRRIVQAQRSTFFCPECQRKSGCHASVIDPS